jgi:hypothetical protein
MDCSICYSKIVDKVFMTCISQHPFCFKCLLRTVETNSELKGCPLCRGGDKYIMLTNDNIDTQIIPVDDFYSLTYFKKSLPILQKYLGDDVTVNTCLISEIMLLCYIKNIKQLDITHKLMTLNYKIDDIIPLIRWNGMKSIEETGIEFVGNLFSELLGTGTNQHPIEPRRSNGSVIFGTGTGPPGSIPLSFPFGLPNNNVFGLERCGF